MKTEKSPDREGYMDFKRRVDSGDLKLELRAANEWEKNSFNFQKRSAWYYLLLFTEQCQTRYFLADNKREDSIRDAERRTALVSNPEVRKQGYARIRDRLDAWDEERQQLHRDHLENRDQSIKERIAKRQVANPGERESESWFWAKFDTEQEHLGRVLEIGNNLTRDLDDMAKAAPRQEHLATRDETESSDIPRARTARRDRDDSRER